ncbi:hypothetical protein HFN89_00115 [Rhizobium laguerreae]|nr:hypothetical protein [Rhizobium laguerreae]
MKPQSISKSNMNTKLEFLIDEEVLERLNTAILQSDSHSDPDDMKFFWTETFVLADDVDLVIHMVKDDEIYFTAAAYEYHETGDLQTSDGRRYYEVASFGPAADVYGMWEVDMDDTVITASIQKNAPYIDYRHATLQEALSELDPKPSM